MLTKEEGQKLWPIWLGIIKEQGYEIIITDEKFDFIAFKNGEHCYEIEIDIAPTASSGDEINDCVYVGKYETPYDPDGRQENPLKELCCINIYNSNLINELRELLIREKECPTIVQISENIENSDED